jgi:hypothetical protein
MRLPHLVGLVRVGDQVTVLTDDTGRPAAALVPVEAARTVAQTRAAQARVAAQIEAAHASAAAQIEVARARAEASAAGWSRRLDAFREQSQRRHEAELRDVAEALAQAWAELNARRAPGGDVTLDRLRAAHQPWLPRSRSSGRPADRTEEPR